MFICLSPLCLIFTPSQSGFRAWWLALFCYDTVYAFSEEYVFISCNYCVLKGSALWVHPWKRLVRLQEILREKFLWGTTKYTFAYFQVCSLGIPKQTTAHCLIIEKTTLPYNISQLRRHRSTDSLSVTRVWFILIIVGLRNRTAERRGQQIACEWRTSRGYYLRVLSWSSLTINVFCFFLQKDLFKRKWSLAKSYFKQNYCHPCHTRFAVFFPLPSCCVSSLYITD